MKKFIILLSVLFTFIFVNQIDLESRSMFIADPGHHWLTPNGKDREDGIPKSKATRDESGAVSIGGGCEDMEGTCWELANNRTVLIVYDAVISPGPGENIIFIQAPDSTSVPPQN